MTRRIFFSLCTFLLATGAARSWADVVVGTGSPASCSEAALNAAVNTVVPNGGVIRFNCGGAATINISSQKLFFWPDNPNLTYGIDGGGLITLNAQGLSRHILHLSGTLNIANITFTGGRATGVGDNGSGGAIRSDRNVAAAVNLSMSNVTFINNAGSVTAPEPGQYPLDSGGGAVFLRRVTTNIINCTFSGNVCNNCSGGALHARAAPVTISGSVFDSNSSNGGGLAGAYHHDILSIGGSGGVAQVVNTRFNNNTALNEGGAIFIFTQPNTNETFVLDGVSLTNNRVVDSGRVDFVGDNGYGGGMTTNYVNVTIRNSTFAGNSARGTVAVNGRGLGGGANLGAAPAVTILNSTFSGNQAQGGNNPLGGGLFIADNAQPFQIIHSTIVGNSAAGQGGGIWSLTNGSLRNTIVANNSAPSGPQCASLLTNAGGLLMWPDNAVRCGSALAIVDPALGPLASNGGIGQTHHPLAGSPVVNAVACAASTDQRGVTRPQGSNCDIGSVEVACGLALSPLTLPTGRVGTAYSQTIAATGGNGSVGLTLSGALPSGMTFNGTSGLLSGTPSQSGNFVITVTASDAFSCAASRTYNLTIASATAVNPVALSVDASGNGVLEPNQTVVVAPSWVNQTGGGLSLTGSASSFIGPAGGTYTIADGSASYGTVTPGSTASCTGTGNCYSLSVAGARPAPHWDASFVESLSSGGPKSWTMHVGGSFTDVSASSPFFRDIETLLHRGITSGCSATTYCPANGTTREQMAVFVLVAKEGTGYNPPACSPPNTFNDVPETSPFCRWIEELARRGVVGGCGGGNYCPSTAVTREQMAIFVLLTLDPTLNPPACSPPNTFNDVPETSAFCRWIEELARRGVVSGCGGGNYCPTSPVTREQMGVFISATFGLTLYGPL